MSSEIINLKVGQRIRNLRKESGLTQEKLSELSGVDYKHIQLLEGKNPTAIKIDTLEKICQGLNISLAVFFEDGF